MAAGNPVQVLRGKRWDVLERLCDAELESVLDIGCRDRELANHLAPGTRYVGLDLGPPADVIASAEEPLPFADDTFSCAVMADVLEHLGDPHGALREALRVSTSRAIVMLPNLYTLIDRLRFVAGRTAGKYEFGPENPVDRHRWLMNFDQASRFTQAIAAEAGWRVSQEYGWDGGFRRRSVRGAYAVARRVAGPNLWAYGYAAVLEP